MDGRPMYICKNSGICPLGELLSSAEVWDMLECPPKWEASCFKTWRKRHNASWDPLDFGVNIYYSWVCYTGPFTIQSVRLGQCKAECGSRTRLYWKLLSHQGHKPSRLSCSWSACGGYQCSVELLTFPSENHEADAQSSVSCFTPLYLPITILPLKNCSWLFTKGLSGHSELGSTDLQNGKLKTHGVFCYEVENISVQFSHSVMSDSLWPHASQQARPPCPARTPGVHSVSCPSSRWCHPAISSSVIPFSSCPQSLPASESFPMSQLFAWGGQSTGVSALASFLQRTPRADLL